MSDKMREALQLADAALSGANMNMAVVRRKISYALAEAEQRIEVEGKYSGFGNGEGARAEQSGVAPPAGLELHHYAAIERSVAILNARADEYLKAGDYTAQFEAGDADSLLEVLAWIKARAESFYTIDQMRAYADDFHQSRLKATPPAPVVPDELAKIAAIAHDGGLAGMSESDALIAIRKITATHWGDRYMTAEARRAAVLAAAPEVVAKGVEL